MGGGLNLSLLLGEGGGVLGPRLMVYSLRFPNTRAGGAEWVDQGFSTSLGAALLVVAFLVTPLVILLVAIFVAPNPLVETLCLCLRLTLGNGAVVGVVVGSAFLLLASGPAL